MPITPLSPELLSRLFPSPSARPSPQSPSRVFGVSGQSTYDLLKDLKDNHTKYHVFFNDRGFHNHAAHHLLAIYALGASGKLIDAAYETHVAYQRPAFESPVTITENNFFEHLGKEENYNAYLVFFSHALSEKDVDIGDVLEKFIFSERFNFDKANKAENKAQPEMLNRFTAGLLHPMIHTGYGVEFGLRGVLAEGLAQMSIHPSEATALVPESFFDFSAGTESTAGSAVSYITNMLPKLSVQQSSATAVSDTANKTHGPLFTIVARMLQDERLAPSKLGLSDGAQNYSTVLSQCGDIVKEYASQWDLDSGTLDDKVEDIFWAHVLIYGVGGWSKEKGLKADFFLMHLVTSALFLSSFIATLKKTSSQKVFLRSYVSISLAWWVSRGRPGFAIDKFYDATGGFDEDEAGIAEIPGPQPTPTDKALKSAGKPCLISNPWYPILQTTLTHPNEHLCKLQRALAHAASHYGIRSAGHFARFAHLNGPTSDGKPGFEGVEKLDGSVFVRVARLTADRLRWMREGEEEGDWDREGFF